MLSVDEQLRLLLRGTRFPDEIEGGDAREWLEPIGPAESPEERIPGGQAGPGAGASDGERWGTAEPGGRRDEREAADSTRRTRGEDVAQVEETAPPGESRSLRAQMTLELRQRLSQGRPLRVYLGVDPTATSLHIGHFVSVQKLRLFQRLGHHVIFVIGDYTALIGDPTDRESERKRFTHEQIREMARDYTRQAFLILDESRTEVRYNSEWLAELRFNDLVELASIFPLKWVVSRRDFRARLERGDSLRLHEALYCLMQGYDAYALECDVQVGGYDQYLNMLAGRWIQSHFGRTPHIPWTTPLLMGSDGRKMSKSFGNAINLQDSPEDVFGKSMRIPDELLPSYIDLTTDLPAEEAEALQAKLGAPGVNPMDVKKEVAANLVRQYHGAEAARAAAEHFRSVIQEKSAPGEIEELRVPESARGGAATWPDLLLELQLAKSKGEVRRLISQGGFYVEQRPVTDPTATYEPKASTLIRIGKRRYYRLVL